MNREYRGGNSEHVKSEEIAYLLAYEEWERTLTDVERKALRDAGADVPDLDHNSRNNTGVTKDAAELSAANVVCDFSGKMDSFEDRLMDAFDLSEKQASDVARLIKDMVDREAMRMKSSAIIYIAGEILMAPNLKLFAAALAYASDLAMTNGMGSMRQWAAKNALTPAAVSKVATRLRRGLGLPTGSHLKSDAISEICAEAQRKKHWRKKKFTKTNYGKHGNETIGARQRGAGAVGMGIYNGTEGANGSK